MWKKLLLGISFAGGAWTQGYVNGLLYLLPGGFQFSASYSKILGHRDLSAHSFSLTGRFEF